MCELLIRNSRTRECQFDREVVHDRWNSEIIQIMQLLYRGEEGLEIQLAWNINNGISEI